MDCESLSRHIKKQKQISLKLHYPVDEKCATAFCLKKIEFVENPKGEQLKAMKVGSTILRLDDEEAKEMPYRDICGQQKCDVEYAKRFHWMRASILLSIIFVNAPS